MATGQGANSADSHDAEAPNGTAREPAIPKQTDVCLDVDSNSKTSPSRVVQSPTSAAETVPAEQGANPTISRDAQPPAATAPEPAIPDQTDVRVDVPCLIIPTSPPPLTPAQQKDVEDGHHYRPLLQAAFKGDWASASEFFERNSPSRTAIITSDSRTALHIAAMSAQNQFVENLVELLSPEELEVADGKNGTAIHYAALGGRIRMVKALVEKNPKLTNTLDGQEFVPLRRSAEYGAVSKEVLWFLAINTKDNSPRGLFPETQALGTIFNLAYAGHFDVSLYLLRQYPHLAKEKLLFKTADTKRSLLRVLSVMPAHFVSGARLNLWERLLYKCVRVDLNSTPNEYSRISKTPTTMAQALRIFTKLFMVEAVGAFKKFLWTAAKVVAPSVQRIRDAKLRHEGAVELAKQVCAEISSMETADILKFFEDDRTFYWATTRGIVEILEVCLESFPELIWTTSNSGRSWLTIAMEYRQEEVCGLLLAANSSDSLSIVPTPPEDAESRAMMYRAAHNSPNVSYLSNVPCAAIQMQRELQWFKAVEGWVHPYYNAETFSFQEGETKVSKRYWQKFLKEHKELLKNGEKWMKSTSSSFFLISTLIAMVLFVAVLIVPGGNNNNTGVPTLLGNDSLMVFAISDALALLFSVAAILSFSAILTSSYEPEEFLYSLPTKMIIGLSSLFFSLAFLLAAFAAALTIVLDERLKWAWIPVTVLSCLPVALFALLQLPALFRMVKSTFGPSIFRPRKIWKRSTNCWMRTCHKKNS